MLRREVELVRDAREHPDLPRFDLDVVLEPDAYRLRVSGTVVVPPSAEARETLGFLLRTDVDGLRIEVLGALDEPATVGIRPGGRVPNMAVTQQYTAELPAPCPPGVPLVLSFEYACGSEENRRWLTLTSEFSFSSSYASAWLPTFGYRRATGELRYSVPSGMGVEATGTLTRLEHRDGRTVHTFDTAVPSVFDFVAGTFTVQRRDGRVPVSIHHLQPMEGIDEILERTARIIAALESEFGPYPFDELAVVEIPMAPAVFAGIEGGAYPGYFLIRTDLLQADGFEDWVVGHELTHFWFPHVVGHKDEAIAPAMLDEALAHYGALRVVEVIGGPATAERFRRDGGDEAIRLTAAGFDHRLAGTSATERWDRVAYNLSNTKGHLVYDMLATTIGRHRFRAALERVLRDHAGGEIGWADFWGTVEDVAGRPLDWFSRQWFESSAIPILSLDWSQTGDRLVGTVSQSAPSFRLDVPVQVEFADGSARMHLVELRDERASFEVSAVMPVHDVRLDPHFTILHATPSTWAEAVARRFVTRGRLLKDDDEFEQAFTVLRQGLDELPADDRWGVECLTRLYIGWLHQDQGRLDEAAAEYEAALACGVRPPDALARLYLNIATIVREQGDDRRMRWAAKNALTAETAAGQNSEIGRAARDMLRKPAG